MADATSDPRKGQVIEGRYRIINRIASGGMGVVYRAERVQLGRMVAIKFLDAANAADETSRARFEREAKAMSRLSHPHCVSVIDFGVSGTPFIVMDYVTGQPLVTLIQTKKKVEASRAVNIMKQVMAALAHAHKHDVIHRDVKPANIMLTEATGTGDFVRILDFGLAKLRGASALSSANLVVGTPSYMSPEQGSGKDLDARSDIYSAGIVLFELLSGDKPFVGDDAFQTLRMHQDDPVPMLPAIRGSDEIRAALDGVLQKALAKKPSKRFQTALAMGEALAAIDEAAADAKRPAKGKKRSRKRDPALVTTQVQPTARPSDDRTEQISGSHIGVRRGSLLRRFVRNVSVLAILAAVSYVGWRAWQTRRTTAAPAAAVASAGDAGNLGSTRGTAPTLDAATVVAAAVADASVENSGLVDSDGGLGAASNAAAMAANAIALDGGSANTEDAAASAVAADDAIPSSDGGQDAALVIDDDADDARADVDETDDADLVVAAPDPDVGATTVLPSGPPKNVDEVRALAKAGKLTSAARGLQRLINAQPKRAYLHRTMGDINVERGWWSEAIKNYTAAVRLKPRYKSFRSINVAAITALGFPKVRGRAERFIRNELGRAALDHLRVAARSNKKASIRSRAEALIKRIR